MAEKMTLRELCGYKTAGDKKLELGEDNSHKITAPSPGDRVYVYELPEETPDGKPYISTEHRGKIAEDLGRDTYRITMDDGESILVKLDDFEICNDNQG